MTRIFIYLFLLLGAARTSAQYPENLVPNPGFENGGGSTDCTFTEEEDFNDAIEAWWASGYVYNALSTDNNPTPDWVNGNAKCGFCPAIPSKYVRLGCGNTEDYEAVLTKTKHLIEGGKSYIFKIRMRAEDANGLIHCEVKNINGGSTTSYMNIGGFQPGTNPASFCKWVTFSNVFHVPAGINYEWVYIKNKNYGPSVFLEIDDVFISEYCTNWIERQNLTWTDKNGLEEASSIVAGNAVSTYAAHGDVIIKANSQLTYKGVVDVALKDGVVIERGSDFVARIAPCGKECASPDFYLPSVYTICDNQCINISGGTALGMTYLWSSVNEAHMQYLLNATIASPMFCPPSNVNQGTYVYNATITNPCGETAIKTVRINYDAISNPTPTFSFINSNLGSKPDQPAFTLKPGPHTEKVLIDITDCDGTVLKSDVYVNGENFNNLGQIIWRNEDYFDPCGCYKIVVKSKNYCYEEWKTETFSWNRNRSLTNVDLANTSICRNGKRYVCFQGTGIDYIKMKIWNNWASADPVFDKTIEPNSTCFEIPNTWSNAGHYSFEATIMGCDGSKVFFEKQPFNVGPCNGNLIEDTTDWVGDAYNTGVIYTNPETGRKDSVYSALYPNPVTDYSTISYHIPMIGQVKITLHNSNFEQTAVLLNSAANFPLGDYEMQFSNADLTNGTNYYKIEYTNAQTPAVHITRFTSIK
jgi:hypothetical protein